MRIAIVLILSLALAPAASGQDLPPTVYDEPDIPPQAMDYDAENKRFVAHPGWLNDKLVHYYKFRMYVPPNYGTDDGGLDKVPIAPLYLPTVDGTLGGVLAGQKPILKEFPAAGNTAYSDFVEVHFVTVPENYTVNAHTSVDDLLQGDFDVTESGIIANAPVVPVGSTLEDPAAPGTDAPIEPWMAWYEGQTVQTFVFETTDQGFAEYINALTRTGDAAAAGSGYESTVSPQMAGDSGVNAIPIWHVNQYFTGVTPGENNGGPADVGQRNIIDKDRLDPGYSPLWQVAWATQVPPGYEADQASHAAQFTEENGFAVTHTPMYVNCPNIGPHGGSDTNPDKATTFTTVPEIEESGSITLEGALIMQGNVPVKAVVDGKSVAETTTNMMGGWRMEIAGADLGPGDNTIRIQNGDGEEVAAYTVHRHGEESVSFAPAGLVLAAVALAGFALARRR